MVCAPGAKRIVVKGIRDPASRLAGLQTGELDLAYGMTGKLLPRVMKDKNLRWDENFTAPWYLLFPGYAEKDSPFHDKSWGELAALAVSITRAGCIGSPWPNGPMKSRSERHGALVPRYTSSV